MQTPPFRLTRGPSVALAGLLASALSTMVLARSGRRDTGSRAAPVNAISHWFWPVQAFERDDLSLKHTLTGALVHTGSAMVWAGAYVALRAFRRRPDVSNAVTDAVAVTAIAALVDLKLVPERLTPGFEKRLRPSSTVSVYVAFAAGLALAGWLTRPAR